MKIRGHLQLVGEDTKHRFEFETKSKEPVTYLVGAHGSFKSTLLHAILHQGSVWLGAWKCIVEHIEDSYNGRIERLTPSCPTYPYLSSEGQRSDIALNLLGKSKYHSLSPSEAKINNLFLDLEKKCKPKSLIMIEHPESIMHVTQQRGLLEALEAVRPKSHFVITTHSPTLIGGFWEDRVVMMKDVINTDIVTMWNEQADRNRKILMECNIKK
jgi:predicted ATP-binding protein involved in virulence